MKLLHIISADLWAGAEVQAFTLLCALKQQGAEIHALLMNEGELANRLRKQAISVYVLNESSSGGLALLQQVVRLMRKIRPDIVHTHRTKENVLGAIANVATVRAPCVRTVHGAPEHLPRPLSDPFKWAYGQIDWLCGRFLQDQFIAVSSELPSLLAKKFPPTKIAVVENGVDVEAVRSLVGPVEFRSSSSTTHVGIVGRLVPVKRIDLFLQIASVLRSRYPSAPWQFHIFGDGPLRQSLSVQVRSLGLEDVTVMHGHRQDIVSCIAALDALVITSDHEGLPMTALEALALGTPIVAHAVGGLVSALRQFENARLISSQSVDTFAAEIWALTRQPSPRAPQVPKHLLSAENAKKMMEIYRRLARSATA